jgi:methylmalonyl-CoA epimerase
VFKGVDHIVIAVSDLDEGIKQYEAILGIPSARRGQLPGFDNVFFDLPENVMLELVAPTDESGPIARKINNTGPGVHLVALRVDDVEETVARLRKDSSIRLLGDPGEGNPIKGQVFVHPASAGGVLVQIVAGGH